MKVRMLSVAVSLVASSTLAGCTWVKLDESAGDVALISIEEAAGCDRLGTTTSTSKSNVGVIDRKDSKVATELWTLAKNAAAEMSGNAIAPEGEIEKGKQTFIVYRCNAD